MMHDGTTYEHSEVKCSFDQRNQWHWCAICNDWFLRHDPVSIVVGVCREDNPRDVDDAYGPGTYERLFPSDEELEPESDMERDRR